MLINGIVPGFVKKKRKEKKTIIYMNQVLIFKGGDFRNSQGSILKSEVIEHTTAPIVASFSSRGPNYIAADILKVRDQLPVYLPLSVVHLAQQYHFSNADIYLVNIAARYNCSRNRHYSCIFPSCFTFWSPWG